MAANKLIAQDLWRSQIRRLGLECMVKISRAAFRHRVTLAPKALTAAFWPHPNLAESAWNLRGALSQYATPFIPCSCLWHVGLAFSNHEMYIIVGEKIDLNLSTSQLNCYTTHTQRAKPRRKTSQYYVHQELEQGGRRDHVTFESNTKRHTCFHGWKRWSGNKSTSRQHLL